MAALVRMCRPVYGCAVALLSWRFRLFWLYAALVLVTGVILALQPVINANIASRIGHPMSAALIPVSVTFLALLFATLALRGPLPTPRVLGSLPPWLFSGGLIGAVFLFVSLLAAPRLGVATTIALLIAGQLAAALTIDHFGWLGVPARPVNPYRVFGAFCLIAGVLLIRRF
jgi:transporter family-2 protein